MNEQTQEHCVIVGLGNPGKKYAVTRHNLGNLVVQGYAQKLGCSFKEEKRLQVQAARVKKDGVTIHLVLPTTYMNESGRAVRLYMNFYKAFTNSLTIVVDDTALPFGQMRFRESGSSGGHNGLKSVRESIGTQNYRRLRMGIGTPSDQRSWEDYVLSGFTQEETEQLPSFILKGANVLEMLATHEVETIMNQVNPKA